MWMFLGFVLGLIAFPVLWPWLVHFTPGNFPRKCIWWLHGGYCYYKDWVFARSGRLGGKHEDGGHS